MDPNNHKTLQRKAVIYCRVSTKEQVDEGNSLTSQERLCREYAIKNGFDIARVFIEQGESAKTQDRKELQNLISFCSDKRNQIAAVIAYKIDRISRNVYDYHQLRIGFKKYGVEIRSTSEHFEDNPAGRFMENIIANVAQFDNDVRAERCVGGMKEAMREGRYVWMAPLGFSNVRISGKSNIVPNNLAPIIRKSFETISRNTFPAEEVRKIMLKEGLVNKQRKPLSKSQFYRLLKNETYAGWIIKFGVRTRGIFEPIISQELFDQVQRVLKFRSRRNHQYMKENPDFPLRRFIFNSSGKLSGAWSKGNRKKYPYYCFRHQKINIRKEVMETNFKTFLDQFRIDKEDYEKLFDYVKKNFVKISEDQVMNRIRHEKQIKELKAKQTLIIEKNYKGIISDVVLKQQSELIEYEIMQAESALLSIPEQKRSLEKLLILVQGYLRYPSTVWEKAPFNEKLQLQWFNFPLGIAFENNNFRTSQISSVYKVKNVIATLNSHKVDFVPQIPNTIEVTKSNNDQVNKEFWDKFYYDIERLAGIITRIENPRPK